MRILILTIAACLLAVEASGSILRTRDPCIPLAQGWESIDDSPTINEALKACGNGGTIILPADQIYSIRSPIDFLPCKDCDFQIEGRLIIARGQWSYWNSNPATFLISNVTGARIQIGRAHV